MTNLTEQLIEENIELEKRNNGLHKLISELEAENTKLKKLLKRVVNATDFCHELKIASVVDYRVWYNIANEINQVLAYNQIQANTVACNKIQENE